jgi:hypothetical protein
MINLSARKAAVLTLIETSKIRHRPTRFAELALHPESENDIKNMINGSGKNQSNSKRFNTTKENMKI